MEYPTELLKKKKSSLPSLTSVFRLIKDTLRMKTNPIKRVSDWIKIRRLQKNIKLIDFGNVFKPKDEKYIDYIKRQLTHATLKSVTKDVSWKHREIMPKVEEFFRKRGLDLKDLSVLCVGCRSTSELENFDNLGFGIVKGIDLYSIHERVDLMDMHDLKFPDNTFNCIYMADVIEHSYDIYAVIHEIERVSKKDALICILAPFDFKVKGLRHQTDFRSPEKLISMFSEVNEIICKEVRTFKAITGEKEIEQEEVLLLMSINN